MKQKRKLGRKLLIFLLTLAMLVGLMPGMSLTAYAADNSTDYVLTIPATLDVQQAGWNATDGLAAQVKIGDTFSATKKLSVTASSSNNWTLKSGDNSVGYTLTTASGGSQTTTWELSADELNASGGTTKAMGIVVEDYSNKPAGAYQDTVTFTASLVDASIPVSDIIINNAPTEALFVNSTGTLTATVSPANATDKTIVWSSSDSNYVSINSETGEYTIMGTKGYGSATITATATNGTEDTSDDVTATCTITGKVTYTSLKAGDVLHTGDTFYTGSTVYFAGSTNASFPTSAGVITIVEATKDGYTGKFYQFKRSSNGTWPNWSYSVKDNTDGVYITGGSGTSSNDRFTLAVHTKE